jgi:hypothetical protein
MNFSPGQKVTRAFYARAALDSINLPLSKPAGTFHWMRIE